MHRQPCVREREARERTYSNIKQRAVRLARALSLLVHDIVDKPRVTVLLLVPLPLLLELLLVLRTLRNERLQHVSSYVAYGNTEARMETDVIRGQHDVVPAQVFRAPDFAVPYST